MTKQQRKDFFSLYEQLSDDQRKGIFSAEEIECFNKMIFFERLFSDITFYKAVEKAIGETAYEKLRQE